MTIDWRKRIAQEEFDAEMEEEQRVRETYTESLRIDEEWEEEQNSTT